MKIIKLFVISLLLTANVSKAAVLANAKVDVTELYVDVNTGLIGFKIENATDTTENWVNCSGNLVHYHRRADNQPIDEGVFDIITSTIYTSIATNKKLWIQVGYEGANICFISKLSFIK